MHGVSDTMTSAVNGLAHRVVRMTGRDPHEPGRVATSLELLFDLTFVVAFGVAGNEAAHLLAEGHFGSALAGFCFAMFAVIWAWINFSWFASAFDTDDWVYRLTTMVQMVGVVILALGLPPMFASIDQGPTLDNSVMVLGYVVMRVAMVAQWLRAARQSPERRRACLTYAVAISIAQLGWIVQIVANMTLAASAAFAVVLVLIELAGPALAERRAGGTPWHAHHIAERYGLLTIIALGEGIIGTVAAVSAVVQAAGLVGGRRAGRSGRHRPDLRHVVDVLHDPECGGAAPAPGAFLRLGLRPHPAVRGDRRHRGGAARGRVLHRARRAHRLGGDGAHGGGAGGRLRPRGLRAARRTGAPGRRGPLAAAGRHGRAGGRCRCCWPRPACRWRCAWSC